MKELQGMIAIIALAGIAAYALWQNIDGAQLQTTILAIAGLGGYSIARAKPQPS